MTASVRSSPAPFGFRFVAPLALGAVLNPINSTMIATALVPIASSLHVSVGATGWLVVALYLTSAVAQPSMGHLADRFGPRRIFLISLLFVAAAGVLGWLASSLTALVVVRVLLGIGTSAAYPAAMRIFRVRAERIGSRPPRVAMGVLSLAALSTTAVGPFLGGVLTGAFGWHSIFAVNVPLSLLTAALILLWIPRDESGATSVEHRAQPFIDMGAFVHNLPLTVTYLRAAAVSMMIMCVYYGFAQWLQSAAGLSSTTAGLVTLPLSIVAAVSSFTGVRTKSLRAPFLVGIGAASIGSVCLFLVDSGTSVWLLAGAVMFFGVPMGTFSTTTQAAVYIQSPAGAIGAAAGLQRTFQYLGASAGAGLLAFMYGQRATDYGLHRLSIVIGACSAVLLIATVFDRTIPADEEEPCLSPNSMMSRPSS
jgi:predicted MFS family arabinose efflux permease